jgi:hypothetical protein
MTDNIRCFAWCHPKQKFRAQLLINSARQFDTDIELIPCRSILGKIASLHHAVCNLAPETIVLCTDGYDCLYTNSPLSSLRSFFAESEKVVLSSQPTRDHHARQYVEHVERETNAEEPSFFCAGVIAGRAGRISHITKVILSWIEDESEESLRKTYPPIIGTFYDQTLFGVYACLNPGEVLADKSRAISYTVGYEQREVASCMHTDQDIPSKFGLFDSIVLHVPTVCTLSYGLYCQISLSLLSSCSAADFDLVRLIHDSGGKDANSLFCANVLGSLRKLRGYKSSLLLQRGRHLATRFRVLFGKWLSGKSQRSARLA